MKKSKDKNKEIKVEKKKNIIARHKLLFLIMLLAFIVAVVLFYIGFSLFIGSNDPYGDRLKGISSVKVSSKEKKEITTFLKEKEGVNNASVRVQGKIIYIHITVGENVSLDQAKAIANDSLQKLSDDEKNFYDIGFFLKQEKENGFVVTGNKNSNSVSIIWIKS